MTLEQPRILKKRYIFLAAVLILAGIGLVTIPDFNKIKEKSPEKLLLSVMDGEKSFSSDEVAKMIINGNPLLQLIDVRTPEEYASYSLPGAINIPIDSMFKMENGKYVWDGYINQKTRLNVFYSNGDIYSSQAWLLCTRLNFKNNYILNEGLNGWFETIIHPQRPPEGSSVTEDNLYRFRKGAQQYFLGGGVQPVAPESDDQPMKPVKKRAVKQEEGGC